jgi:hypothetical protein
MKSLKYAFATAVTSACFGLSPVSAAVIYDGGSPDQSGTIYSEAPDYAAMSFTLTSGATITGVNWWGDCFSATTCGSSPVFQIDIWTNNSGVPGTVLDFVPAGTGNQTATGKTITGGYDEYSYSVGIPSFALAPGTYFLSIQETEAEPAGNWSWEQTGSAPAGAYLEWYDGSAYQSLPEQLAFQLTGPAATTPIPAALPLFITGLGAMGVFGWRRKRKSGAIAA